MAGKFFEKLVSGLTKTRNNIVSGLNSIFTGFSNIDDDFYEELEETLIMSDIGVNTTEEILDTLKEQVKELKIKEPMECKSITAYIPDNPDIYEFLTGIQYLNFVADIFGIEQSVRQERIKTYGDLFGITENLGDLISSYSHGMKQKVAIISALVHEPKLLVLDEPFVGLDPKAALDLKNIMKELCRRGSAIFFSTHVLEVAQKLCNKIAIIKDGKLVTSGNMEEVVKNQSLEDLFMEVTTDDK